MLDVAKKRGRVVLQAVEPISEHDMERLDALVEACFVGIMTTRERRTTVRRIWRRLCGCGRPSKRQFTTPLDPDGVAQFGGKCAWTYPAVCVRMCAQGGGVNHSSCQ